MNILLFSEVTLRRLIVANVSEEITTSIFRAKQSKKNGTSLKVEALFCYETSLTISQHGVTVQKT